MRTNYALSFSYDPKTNILCGYDNTSGIDIDILKTSINKALSDPKEANYTEKIKQLSDEIDGAIKQLQEELYYDIDINSLYHQFHYLAVDKEGLNFSDYIRVEY